MGFDAIQISPVIKNMEEDTSVGEPYHGYWSQDLTQVNPKFGTKEDLKELVDELHKRDMYLMVDVVVNHMAQKFDNNPPPKVDFSKFKPFNDEKYFHSYCNVTEWENSTNYQNCWLYPYGVALADLKTESPDVVSLFSKWIKELVSTYSIDGLRIDAAKHVNDEFLPKFVEAAGVFSFGEVLTGVTEDMCRYQNKTKNLLPGMPNYLDFYPLNAAFNGGSFERLGEIRAQAIDSCNDTLALGTFIENHDMPRFASQNQDLALAKNAMTYVIMNDGIPTGKTLFFFYASGRSLNSDAKSQIQSTKVRSSTSRAARPPPTASLSGSPSTTPRPLSTFSPAPSTRSARTPSSSRPSTSRKPPRC